MVTARRARLALALWTVFAVLVWNVVFDYVIVVVGRQYIRAAGLAVNRGGPYERAEDWMRPAARRALVIATSAGALVLGTGILSMRFAAKRDT